ncbi:MAG: NfeD family protein [Chloroflexi bacterium]|nr:NfeD family protein [Chloroflexota bacterium]
MCHLVLLMPVLGLPLFWLLPLSDALPGYGFIVLLSAGLYWPIARAMRRPVQDGFQSLVGTSAEVVSRSRPEQLAHYLVRSGGELWSAYCNEALEVGEQVKIVGVKGIGVIVRREGHPEGQGATDNERNSNQY